MNGFERRKRNKTEQIFDVAFRMFSQYGFSKVSVNEIAEQANVSPATIYNYFGTKERLYIDMLRHWMDKQLARYEAILLDSVLSFPEKTKRIMLLEAGNVKFLSDELGQVPHSEQGRLAGMMERYAEEKVGAFFRHYVALGKREGYVREELPDEVAAIYFTMYKNELERLWSADGSGRSDRHIERLMELFFYGLVGQSKDGDGGERSSDD
ncbi:TetR/AcrR family transcriptional regulator [Paenibacillus mendelii]|uniref:TetR/AcrR family transcriptional regulator n=1 Tax=Paenibacillus mendelii TaxID=206163 RepID=A0ABV6J581_9BACL|nr:TetR/AcrR family transcriptional regulator [Paenibacillus mendelii]MCQ6560547.1 TetR/AcrR family transcriptional regulator [Paenibacillus mendelii]